MSKKLKPGDILEIDKEKVERINELLEEVHAYDETITKLSRAAYSTRLAYWGIIFKQYPDVKGVLSQYDGRNGTVIIKNE